MIIQRNLLSVIVFITLTFFSFQTMADDVPEITVEVSGAGETHDKAKLNAIRNALQLAFKQLVIVDRVIAEDEVKRDRVLSTANGYVEKYVERNVNKTDLGYVVEAEITVSASRIQNFLGIVTGGGGSISGPLIDQKIQNVTAQILAAEAQAKARHEIFTRVFDTYPLTALEFKLKGLSLSPKDPNILELEIEQRYKPQFVESLEQTLGALSIYECTVKTQRFDTPTINTRCPKQQQQRITKILHDHMPAGSSSDAVKFSRICIGHDSSKSYNCYILDVGASFDRQDIRSREFKIFAAFIDSKGSNAMKNQQCFEVEKKEFGNSNDDMLGIYLDHRANANHNAILVDGIKRRVKLWSGFHLSTTPKIFHAEINANDIDLARAEHFIAVGGMFDRKGGGLVGMTSRETPLTACEYVEDAIRQYNLDI